MTDTCRFESVVPLVLVVLGPEIRARSKFAKVRRSRSKGLGMIHTHWLTTTSPSIELSYLGRYEYVRMEVWPGAEVRSVKKEGKRQCRFYHEIDLL